jgi:hypothetical protein
VQFVGTPAVNDYIEFTLPSIAAGTYTVDLYYKAYFTRGICQASIDGVNIGTATDEYASLGVNQVLKSLGNMMLTAADHTIRFTITGKGSGSAYTMTIDKIVLTLTSSTDTGTSTATTTATGTATGTRTGTTTGTATSTSTTTGNCITTLINDGYAAGTAPPCSACKEYNTSLTAQCTGMIDCLAPPKTQASVLDCQHSVGGDSVVADCVSALTTAACPNGF